MKLTCVLLAICSLLLNSCSTDPVGNVNVLAFTPLKPVKAKAKAKPTKKRSGYVLHAWDGVTMWATILNDNYYPKPNRQIPKPAARFSRRILEEMIDEEAAAHIDAISYCLFTAFWSDVPKSKVTDLFPWRPPGMDKAGIDPLKVLIDRCHHHKMKFIADIRMNDRHGARQGIAKKHPEWIILGSANDFAIDGVRKAMLTFTEEVLDNYDVDGIEFDYMRWCHMFKPGEGKKNAHLLTKFTRRARALIDRAAKRKGQKRLQLGVRVPQRLIECDYLGFDIATWIKEGLVDYVVPSDFFHSDVNMKTDDFVKLAKGTKCRIYPAIHPMISMDGPNEHYRLMNLTNYRAAAKNYYGFGAHGVSPYNYQRGFERRATAHRSSSSQAYMWPAALGWLRELRYPDEVDQRDRHYLFYSIYKKPRLSPTGFSNDDNIYLDRVDSKKNSGQRRFRMAEDFGDTSIRTTIQFKAVGLTGDESLEIQLNGKKVPIDYISRAFDQNGQNVYEGDTLSPFYVYVIDMNWETTGRKQPLVFGDNKLSVRLVPPKPGKGTTSFRFVDMVLGVQADDEGGVSPVDLNGYLDDFAVWSRVLTSAEIKKIVDNGQKGIGIKAAKLTDGLRVLYEFDQANQAEQNSAKGSQAARQVGPRGVKVGVSADSPRIGPSAGDFTGNDATLKVAAKDVQPLFPGKGGSMTVAYWLKAKYQKQNHTVWAMSNLPIPSPQYSKNRSRAIFATQTIVVGKPEQLSLGLVRPGRNQTMRQKSHVTDGKWHHIVVTIEQHPMTAAVNSRMFIDGKLAGTTRIPGNPQLAKRIVSIEELEAYVYVRK